jgi:SPP1 family predicted phage head-tail adaptor
MNIGKLRHRLLVEEPVTTQNETGEEVINWLSHGRIWGEIEPLTGREALQAGMVSATLDTRITVRWSPLTDLMNAKWRLSHAGVVYNLVSVQQVDMGRRQIEIMANSGRNLG